MRPFLRAVVLSGLAASALPAQAAPPKDPEVGLAQLALTNAPAKNNAKLTVTTPAFKNMGDIPFENTQYQGNVFPGLEWTAGPAGTKGVGTPNTTIAAVSPAQPNCWNAVAQTRGEFGLARRRTPVVHPAAGATGKRRARVARAM